MQPNYYPPSADDDSFANEFDTSDMTFIDPDDGSKYEYINDIDLDDPNDIGEK